MAHHHHDHDLAHDNAQHFNALANTYDDLPGAQELTRRVGALMQQAYPFNEDETIVMDFACGTGLVSRALAPYAKTLVGVDVSQGMVDEYNRRVANQGIPPEEMRAVCAELKGEPGELDGLRFDVVICSMAYHHLAAYADTTRTLAAFLKPGGTLFVVDIMRRDAAGGDTMVILEQYHHVVSHAHGLGETDMRGAFEGAGLRDFRFAKAINAKKFGKPLDIFIAQGTKPLDV